MVMFNRLFIMMFNMIRIQKIATMIALPILLFMGCTEKIENVEMTIDGRVGKYPFAHTSGMAGFIVTLSDPAGIEPTQTYITESDGSFRFIDLGQNTYQINVERDNWVWRSMAYGDESNDWDILFRVANESHTIETKSGSTTRALVFMDKTSNDEDLTITDINGNPIGDIISVPNGTVTLGLRIYNNTMSDRYWWVDIDNSLSICGTRDTVVQGGNGQYTHGYTGIYCYPLYTGITQDSGTLSPGNVMMVVININPEIYTIDHYQSGTNYLLSQYAFQINGRNIGLSFPDFEEM